ncbi:hypothetical protein M3Y98_00621100 [Aphelenchoides besseyi]|nr:hypothetical protein M3Y98_00621100 [Aphelenchoides besseyi]KAI6208384.1 hypothetical protein M3Y96_00109400 [Aphelenchoides besseyi]
MDQSPSPMSKSIEKWMFYAVGLAGKSTVACVHPRYLVTFRHGTHLLLEVGSVTEIFHAENEPSVESGFDVTIAAPTLIAAGKSEIYLLVDFERYYFYRSDRPFVPLVGPFYLGTEHSSRGDSGGACWSSRGLIRINYGAICMPDFGFTPFTTSEADMYSRKNIITPAVYIEGSLTCSYTSSDPINLSDASDTVLNYILNNKVLYNSLESERPNVVYQALILLRVHYRRSFPCASIDCLAGYNVLCLDFGKFVFCQRGEASIRGVGDTKLVNYK